PRDRSSFQHLGCGHPLCFFPGRLPVALVRRPSGRFHMGRPNGGEPLRLSASCFAGLPVGRERCVGATHPISVDGPPWLTELKAKQDNLISRSAITPLLRACPPPAEPCKTLEKQEKTQRIQIRNSRQNRL